MICRGKGGKAPERVGKVLFIDAKNEITRKDSFSFLEDKHINKIVDAYRRFENIDNFASVETIGNLLNNNSSLSVQFYVNHIVEPTEEDEYSTSETYNQWLSASEVIDETTAKIVDQLTGGTKNE